MSSPLSAFGNAKSFSAIVALGWGRRFVNKMVGVDDGAGRIARVP